ncbi:IKU1 protein [Nymphaea thermarum]|nr:IKU1 protein [Nymphaea thermarum]
MNSSDSSGVTGNSRHSDHLGVNNQSHKIAKNVRKSPIHQSNYGNARQQQPQPQVYNINKSEFRNIVQQLTGSPVPERQPPPPVHPPKPPSMRLQKIRPPPLMPISRPQAVPQPVVPPHSSFNNAVGYNPAPPAPISNNMVPNPMFFARPNNPNFLPSPTFSPLPPLTPGDAIWANTAESPISAYMRYLQNSIVDPGPRPAQQQQLPPGLLPTPPPLLPSPQANPPPLLPSPTSQFLLPSPTFLPLSSPRSPFPLPSPGSLFPSPGFFSFPSPSQSGILGPGPQLPPPSPGFLFPSSPVDKDAATL